MSITGYIYAAGLTFLVGLCTYVYWLKSSKESLQEELAASEYAVMQLVENNVHNQAVVDGLLKEVRECATLRDEAARSAMESEQRLYEMRRNNEERSDARADEIKDQVESFVPRCDCVVPPRATELLVEAACGANRDTDCS